MPLLFAENVALITCSTFARSIGSMSTRKSFPPTSTTSIFGTRQAMQNTTRCVSFEDMLVHPGTADFQMTAYMSRGGLRGAGNCTEGCCDVFVH